MVFARTVARVGRERHGGDERIDREERIDSERRPEKQRHQGEKAPARAQQNFCNYVNGGLQWRSGSTWAESPRTRYVAQLFDAVNVFVGQRRGAIRCVNGSCRQFQPFEGAAVSSDIAYSTPLWTVTFSL